MKDLRKQACKYIVIFQVSPQTLKSEEHEYQFQFKDSALIGHVIQDFQVSNHIRSARTCPSSCSRVRSEHFHAAC